MSNRPVVTRIAPSPTGYMHIGTARTALFNWLYAKHVGGKFLLRIEDTDRERSTEPAVKAIFDGLEWLGLKADAEPVFQVTRADRHAEVAHQLLAAGRAYRCYMTVEEVAAEREIARAEGRAIRSPWRDQDAILNDRPFVIRFKSPQEGETIVRDAVKGEVTFRNRELDDLIVLRSDGSPTYNLAVVVDDHDMGITHVIRGDDHVNNAARQTQIYEAMGWEVPVWAHLPLIHGADGAKLSKRHGAQAVSDFDAMGYLPEAMRNYLARLGWGHGNDEIFSDEQAIQWFDIVDVVRAPARLDWDKLAYLNNYYIRQADIGRLADLVTRVHARRNFPVTEADRTLLERTIPLVRDGAKTLIDLADATVFALRKRPLELPKKTRAQLNDETRARLVRLRDTLASHAEWQIASLEAKLRSFGEAEGVGMGNYGPVVRAALSGGSPAPDLASAMVSLGKNESLARLDDALSQAS